MARIRTVKPDYPKHRKTRSVCRDARLLNIHLWNLADDDGRLRELPQWIIGEVFPTDEDVTPAVLRGLLEELAEARLIVRYEVEGERYIQCHDWDDHQKISHPSKSVLPPFKANFEALQSHSGGTPEPLSPEGKGKEEEKEGKRRATAPPLEEPSASGFEEVLQALDHISHDRGLTLNSVAVIRACKEHPEIDLIREARECRHKYVDGDAKSRRVKDVAGLWRKWLENVTPPAPSRPGREHKSTDRSAYAKVEPAT